MKKKIVTAVALAMMTALTTGAPAFAHIEGNPCVATNEPGHSEFAQHHIAAQAKEGLLGAGGHVPGTHQGFSLCNPSGH